MPYNFKQTNQNYKKCDSKQLEPQMGSLPNLSEICKEEDIPIYFKPGLALGRVQPQSFRNERTKIRYRQSERGEMPKTKRKMYPPTTTTTTKWMPFDDLILQVPSEILSLEIFL